MIDPTIISAGISLLGGLFGGKKKDPTPASNIVSQAAGVRQASEQYGFNPLTLLQYGQPGGALGGGSPPLASNELILGAMKDVVDVVSGDAARRRAAADLELELGRVKLDQLRGSVLGVAPSAAGAVGSGAPALGRRAATVVAQPFVNPKLGMAENWLSPGREKQAQPVSNGAGVTEIDNRFTDAVGGPISVPGDGGEPWGIDEVVTALGFGGAQVAWRLGKAAGAAARDVDNWEASRGLKGRFRSDGKVFAMHPGKPFKAPSGGGAVGISNGFGVVPPRF